MRVQTEPEQDIGPTFTLIFRQKSPQERSLPRSLRCPHYRPSCTHLRSSSPPLGRKNRRLFYSLTRPKSLARRPAEYCLSHCGLLGRVRCLGRVLGRCNWALSDRTSSLRHVPYIIRCLFGQESDSVDGT